MVLSSLILSTTYAWAASTSSKQNTPTKSSAKTHKAFPGDLLPFDNIEGIIVLKARVHVASRDTAGEFVLDTGAGYLALDRGVARSLEILASEGDSTDIGTTRLPVDRLDLGSAQIDHVAPVITLDATVVRQVSDREILGLIGQRVIADQALVLDYRMKKLGLVPIDTLGENAAHAESSATRGTGAGADPIKSSRLALEGAISAHAKPIRFRIAGDGKILLNVRVSNPRLPHLSEKLTMILDTGATKTVLFEDAVASLVSQHDAWPALHGLTAPTLMGIADASLARVPTLRVFGDGELVSSDKVDVAIIKSELETALKEDVGETVHGLLGYSFLRRYRMAIDYPHRVLWLESVPHTLDERPYEYSHVGLQIERRAAGLSVVGVVEGSPAATAGVRRGDVLVAIAGKPVADSDVLTVSRALEGSPGSRVRVTLRRDGEEHTYDLVRRRLL